MNKTIKIRNIKYNIVFLILFFITCLDSITKQAWLQVILKHVDEAFVFCLIVYVFLNWKIIFTKKKSLVLFCVFFYIIGTLSSIVFHYQNIVASMIDAVLIIDKFILGYFATYIYCYKSKIKIMEAINFLERVIVVVLFLLAVHDLFFSPIFPKGDYRYFMDSLRLMFSHPTYLSAGCVTLLIGLGYYNQGKKNLPYMLLITIVGFTTLRGKVIGFLIIYWAFYLCIVVLKNRQYFIMILCGILGCVFIGYDQIKLYFLTPGRFSPRQIMFKDSINLAMEHFPLGTGFGSYGSSVAADYYSVLYEKLGYNDYYGMKASEPLFLTDGFWPIIIAQFGVFGTLIFIIIIYILLKYCFKIIKTNVYAGFAMLMIMINVLINSIAETSFFNPTSLLLFMLFGIFEAENTEKEVIV